MLAKLIFFVIGLARLTWAIVPIDCNGERLVAMHSMPLTGKTCGTLLREDCIYHGEAKTLCPCTCDYLIYGAANANAARTNGMGGRACFRADDQVTLSTGEQVTLQQLSTLPDALVLTRDGVTDRPQFAPVRFWLHAQADMSLPYLLLETENGRKMYLSDEHLIYRTGCGLGRRSSEAEAVFARRVSVGDCIFVYDNETQLFTETRLMKKSRSVQAGVYAPITSTGSIVVNQVLASCYTNFENESVQKLAYDLILNVRELFSAVLPDVFADNDLFGSRRQSDQAFRIPKFVFNMLDMSSYFVH